MISPPSHEISDVQKGTGNQETMSHQILKIKLKGGGEEIIRLFFSLCYKKHRLDVLLQVGVICMAYMKYWFTGRK